ncbi:MAG: 3'(2'),5'-bisphosphate nucleotidase CysQ [Minicystis sp.]
MALSALDPREIAAVLAIAREASALVLAVYGTPFEVELKGPNDPVTVADRRANAQICAALEKAFPGDAIVAEESVPTAPEALAALVAHERVWFVDPLDGTREFADRNGEFSVMIGLAVAGSAALGVVVMPTTGEAFVGALDTPAFLEASDGSRHPLRVSSVRDPAEATLMVSRSHRAPQLLETMREALGIRRVVPCGSVGVKVARVATAEADLYVHEGLGAKRWDSCAPEAILAAAGGRFSDLDGASIDYTSADLMLRNGLIASNGALHDPVRAALIARKNKRA